VREGVVHEPETAAVLESDLNANGSVGPAEQPAVAAARTTEPTIGAEPRAEAPGAPPRNESATPARHTPKNAKREKKPTDFEQLTMFGD
jgi:hypothetical protein